MSGERAGWVCHGTVPGGTVTAAELKYNNIRKRDQRYCYHGRVVRQAGWTVCQYLFFYAINDWRSHRLVAPPAGYQWYQAGADYVLVDRSTGIIAQALLAR